MGSWPVRVFDLGVVGEPKRDSCDICRLLSLVVSVDLAGEDASVVEQELVERRVVLHGVRVGELRPGGPAAAVPFAADVLGLLGFDRSGCVARFAPGDVGPDDRGGFLAFAVIEAWPDGSWNGG